MAHLNPIHPHPGRLCMCGHSRNQHIGGRTDYCHGCGIEYCAHYRPLFSIRTDVTAYAWSVAAGLIPALGIIAAIAFVIFHALYLAAIPLALSAVAYIVVRQQAAFAHLRLMEYRRRRRVARRRPDALPEALRIARHRVADHPVGCVCPPCVDMTHQLDAALADILKTGGAR